jgi:hypothetical protein
MRAFVPTRDPWSGGLQALADAITQAPVNRAKVRQMELDAANAAADNARADAALKLQQEQNQRELEKWAFEKKLKQTEESRAAALHPLTMKDTQLGTEGKSIANEFAVQNNPILLKRNGFEADQAGVNLDKSRIELANVETARSLELARVGALPGAAESLADAVYGRVHAKMPKWDLAASLDEPVLPEREEVPGAYRLPPRLTDMDYPAMAGSTAGMDEISRRMSVRGQIGNLADAAVLADPKLDQAKWIKDQTEAFGGGPAAGYRPATPAEKAAFGVDEKTPLVINTEDGKPTILSDGKTTIDLSGGTNKQVFDTVKERADLARAANAGLTALTSAEAALPGMISGALANERLALQKLGALIGVADPSSITSTEVLRASMQPVVAGIVRNTVGSSQISDADRAFAEKAAAGDITLDETSIRRLIGIIRAANAGVVRDFNQSLDTVYPEGQGFDRERALFRQPNVPKFYPSPIGPQLPEYQPQAAIPDAAVERLMADPSAEAIAEFDEVFGPGAAATILNGRN